MEKRNNMIKTEIFAKILSFVAIVCRAREEDIINSSKVQSVVEARTILVYYLRRAGFSNDDISTMFLLYGKPDTYFPTEQEIKSKSKGIDKMWYAFADKTGQICHGEAQIREGQGSRPRRSNPPELQIKNNLFL